MEEPMVTIPLETYDELIDLSNKHFYLRSAIKLIIENASKMYHLNSLDELMTRIEAFEPTLKKAYDLKAKELSESE